MKPSEGKDEGRIEIPADLFITELLDNREPRRFDPELELTAMRLIADRMVNDPSGLLPAYVSVAMEVTEAFAAGITLVDDADPASLHWCHLQGAIAGFDGTRSPRIRAVSSERLLQGTPILIAHPERVYGWIADAGLSVPEALVVPLRVADKYLGTLWVGSHAPSHFDAGDARLLAGLSDFVGIALQMARTQAGLQRSLEQQEIIASEMGHRLKNVFAVADGMIRAAAKNAVSPDVMADTLTGRLHALEKAHSLLRRTMGKAGNGKGLTDLRTILAAITGEQWSTPDDGDQPFRLDGPAVGCGEHATNGIALLVHELATNALKHGSLARGGHVAIIWRLEGDWLRVVWEEHGGPAYESPPARRGFGTSLIERTVAAQFSGNVERTWGPNGLSMRLCLRVDRLAA